MLSDDSSPPIYANLEALQRRLHLSCQTQCDNPFGRILDSFPLRVPDSFVKRMVTGSREDPLLRQVFPDEEELVVQSGFSQDPLGEQAAMPLPGAIRKFQDRLVLITTEQCAIHCRYCFRRCFPTKEVSSHHHLEGILSYLKREKAIHEVILSGGDPWMLPEMQWQSLIAELAAIGHLKRIRIHTRVPIVWPEKVTSERISVLASSRLPVMVVIQCNHPQELDHTTALALKNIAQAGIRLLNQSVLLRGVNDHWNTLYQLSESLFEQGVMPYYLHLLDRVQGTHHFEVPESHAKDLLSQLRQKTPGYLIPQLMRDSPQGKRRIA